MSQRQVCRHGVVAGLFILLLTEGRLSDPV
jgi:hypothetical protein